MRCAEILILHLINFELIGTSSDMIYTIESVTFDVVKSYRINFLIAPSSGRARPQAHLVRGEGTFHSPWRSHRDEKNMAFLDAPGFPKKKTQQHGLVPLSSGIS